MDPAFASWCHARGVTFEGVTPGFVAEGWRGMVASRALSAGQVVLRVPASALLWTGQPVGAAPWALVKDFEEGDADAGGVVQGGAEGTTDGASTSGPLFLPPSSSAPSSSPAPFSPAAPPAFRAPPAVEALPPRLRLAARLLAEAASPSSPWRPYLLQMPRAYASVEYFPESAIRCLLRHRARSRAAREAAEAAEACVRLGAAMAESCPGLPVRFRSTAACRWALASVASRTMHLTGCPGGALTPAGDLFNHGWVSSEDEEARNLLAAGSGTRAGGEKGEGETASCAWIRDLERDLRGFVGDSTLAAAQADGKRGKSLGSRAETGAGRVTSPDELSQASKNVVCSTVPSAAASIPSPSVPPPPSAPFSLHPSALCGFDAPSSCYLLRAARSCPAGRQVYVPYGEHSSLELLVLYGFVPDANAADVAELDEDAFPPDVAERVRGDAVAACLSSETDDRGRDAWEPSPFRVSAEGKPSTQLLQALRLSLLPPHERRGMPGNRALAGLPATLASEERVWLAIESAVQSALAEMDALLAEREAEEQEQGKHEQTGWQGGNEQPQTEHKATCDSAASACAAESPARAADECTREARRWSEAQRRILERARRASQAAQEACRRAKHGQTESGASMAACVAPRTARPRFLR